MDCIKFIEMDGRKSNILNEALLWKIIEKYELSCF